MATEKGAKYDLRGAQFAGGVVDTVHGDQIGGTINNYGSKLDEINHLIVTLRESAQTLPPEQKADALIELGSLEEDLAKPSSNKQLIGQRLKKLAAIAMTTGAIAGGAATITGNFNDFANNFITLSETLGIPIDLEQT